MIFPRFDPAPIGRMAASGRGRRRDQRFIRRHPCSTYQFELAETCTRTLDTPIEDVRLYPRQVFGRITNVKTWAEGLEVAEIVQWRRRRLICHPTTTLIGIITEGMAKFQREVSNLNRTQVTLGMRRDHRARWQVSR